MWFTRVSLANPVFATMLMLALMVLGVFSYQRLKVDQFPNVDFPVVVVTVDYPGASPEIVESEVTKKIEEGVNSIAGINALTSRSYESTSVVIIEFQLHVDGRRAAEDVREKVASVRPTLRDEVKEPRVLRFDPASSPIWSVAVLPQADAGAKAPDAVALTSWADQVLKKRLENVRGVGAVNLVGATPREINIYLQPEALEAYAITPDQIVNAVRSENQDLPLGAIRSREQERVVQIDARMKRPQDFERIIVAQRGGAPVRLGQLARVQDGAGELETVALYNSSRTLLLSVQKAQDENTIEVVDGLNATLREINTQLADAIADFETVDEATVEPQDVSIVLNGARVSMLEDPRYIEANMELRVVRSPQHASLNEQSEIFFMLPKQISLDGKLFDSVEETDQGLDVAFVLTFDAESFGFIEEGLQRTDLATYSYDGDANTVSITTLPGAGGSLTYDVSISGGEGNWFYLALECSAAGGAECPSEFWEHGVWTDRSIEYRTPYGDELDLGGECFGEGDDTFCYVPWSNALDDLRIGLRTRELWFLDRAEIAAEEGVFRLGDEWNDNGLGLNADSGFVVATLHDPYVDLDEDGRFLKAMLTASVEGRLSPNLPEMSVVLNASRDGYRTAAADLTLTWGDSLVRIDIDQDDVTDVTEVLESFTISDGAGTTMRILNVVDLPQGENGDIGQITKDGTVYGTIRQENEVVLVHWIDNRIETLF